MQEKRKAQVSGFKNTQASNIFFIKAKAEWREDRVEG
jgi:hypothetical protein